MQTQDASSLSGLRELLNTHLWLKMLISLVIGVGIGFLILQWEQGGDLRLSIADWLAVPGSIYLTIIQMVIVPLILSSIILALADITQKAQAKKIATTALIFVLVTTCIAALLGIAIVTLFKPGVAIQETAKNFGVIEINRGAVFSFTPQSVVRLIPANPLASLLNGDLLEVLIISLIFGLVISRMDRKKSEAIIEVLIGIQSLCMLIITWTMKLAPFAVFGLMTRAVVTSGVSVLFGMIGYLLSTFAGFIAMALLYLVWIGLIGKKPWQFLVESKEPLLLAFSLSSSAATMPNTLETAKNKLKIAPDVAEFLIPLGTAINMAGSALWQTSATVFLAQAFGGGIDFATIVTIVILTIGASIGTPGVPGAGVGVLTTTLKTVGVPASGIPLILGVDRLVDMGSTVINVLGDLIMCVTVEWVLKKEEKEK